MMIPVHPKYRADIDGLRALAVLSVVAFHAFPEWVRGGFIGVDIFFVISGFLISGIIFENLENGTFTMSTFYARRVKRIFPALVLVLITCYVIGWYMLFTDEYQRLGKHIAAGALFVSNFQLWHEAGYFDASADTKPLLHLWSLGIEEQFYIVWPVLIWFAWKRKINLLAVTVCVAFISFYLNLKSVEDNAVAAFYSPQTRFWELLIGSVLAWLSFYKSHIPAPKKYRFWNAKFFAHILSTIGLFLILYGLLVIDRNSNFPGLWALLPVAGAGFLILAGTEAWINRTILANRLVVWFGLISFPLYLWHWPLLAYATIVKGTLPGNGTRVSIVLLSIALAWLTYKFIERPVRSNGKEKVKLWVLFILMIGVGYAGYETYERDGLSIRMAQKDQTVLRDLIQNPLPKVNDIECGAMIPELEGVDFDGGCRLSRDAAPTVMFLGDSHTGHYRNAVWENFSRETVLMIVQTSCLPFAESGFMKKDDCQKKYDVVTRYLEKKSSIKTVFLSGYWSYLMSGGMVKKGNNWRTARPLSTEGTRSFKSNAVNLISKIIQSGKEVVFMNDIPDLNFDIQSCVDLPPTLRKLFMPASAGNCLMSYGEYVERVSSYDAVVADILKIFPSVKVYNPRPLFCQQDRCRGSDGLLPYYFNGDHVNRHGAAMVIGDLLDWYSNGSRL